jgi:hypothetical protein
MTSQYEVLIQDNLDHAFDRPLDKLAEALPAKLDSNRLCFRAFGADCALSRRDVELNGQALTDPRGILISLYARHARSASFQGAPYVSFKDLPGSMPYHGAFSANSERVLVPLVPRLWKNMDAVLRAFDGPEDPKEDLAGDFSVILFPLPKIALAYICYLPDDEFPAAVTCLFSRNALTFMPLDGLADVAEYTAKGIAGML